MRVRIISLITDILTGLAAFFLLMHFFTSPLTYAFVLSLLPFCILVPDSFVGLAALVVPG